MPSLTQKHMLLGLLIIDEYHSVHNPETEDCFLRGSLHSIFIKQSMTFWG